MEKIAFIGGFDKSDLLLYIAKILQLIGKKVLLIDTTAMQKLRYIVPTIQPQKQYIIDFQKVDIALGFQTLDEIKKYKQENDSEPFEYDYILYDIDTFRAYYYFQIKPEDKHFFVTGFDLYSLRKGIQVLKRIPTPVEVTKVYFTKELLDKENKYVDFLTKDVKFKWDNDIIYFPFETSDLSAIHANERTGKIRVGGVSLQYIDSLAYIVEEATGLNSSNIKKAIKILEK